MTLEEAINTLGKLRLPIKTEEDHRNHLAVRLGIEALKRLQDNRRDPEFDHWILLPGETESPS